MSVILDTDRLLHWAVEGSEIQEADPVKRQGPFLSVLTLLIAFSTFWAAPQSPPLPPDEARFASGVAHALAGEFDQARSEIVTYRQRAAYSVPAREVLRVVEGLESGKIDAETAAHVFKGIALFNQEDQDESLAA
jgi:hypothetical protein